MKRSHNQDVSLCQLGGWLVLLYGVSQNVTAVSDEPIPFLSMIISHTHESYFAEWFTAKEPSKNQCPVSCMRLAISVQSIPLLLPNSSLSTKMPLLQSSRACKETSNQRCCCFHDYEVQLDAPSLTTRGRTLVAKVCTACVDHSPGLVLEHKD